jgi:hypothetical protein
MSILVKPAPVRKVRCTGKLLARPGEHENFGVLEIDNGKQTDLYHLWRVPSDWGVAWRLDKLGEEASYHVCLDPVERRHECECPSFLRWRECRHVESLLMLHEQGTL